MKTKYILRNWMVLLLGAGLFISCEDYLDKAPEVNIKDSDVFTKFESFQGYVEDIYQCIPDETLGSSAEMNWNYGDEFLSSTSIFMNFQFDRGNYWFWQTRQRSPYAGVVNYVDERAKGDKGWWHNGWFAIRKCNIVLSHLNDLVSPTQEERDILAGQAYFFRGLFHFQILRAWGGIPYVDTVYAPSDIIRTARLSYLETAQKVTQDLKKAAELLPGNWDETTVGQTTLGYNKGRVTKLAAYGYMGKNLLYAGSPLMNGITTGNYSYNQELCAQAANAFWEVIKLGDQGYATLEPWSDYFRNFYTMNREHASHNQESIFSGPVYMRYKRWNYGSHQLRQLGGWGAYDSPTANYVEYFGMENGLAIDEEDSGYDPTDPWGINGAPKRDPRFYYNIVHDRQIQVINRPNTDPDKYFEGFTGGRHRTQGNSMTGYGYKKFIHVTCNNKDNGWNNVYGYENPEMRLADIYLMYAEAVNEAYGPNGSAPGGITAVQAINKIRNRALLPDLDARYYTSKEEFRDFIWKERAVELAFEGHRWYDLRRWYVAHLPEYREKYSLEFDKDWTYFRKELYYTKVFEPKHYWFPFPTDQVNIYPEFYQNPGW
jgi:starch-binding outer membrane protein, SusD/RagB family